MVCEVLSQKQQFTQLPIYEISAQGEAMYIPLIGFQWTSTEIKSFQ